MTADDDPDELRHFNVYGGHVDQNYHGNSMPETFTFLRVHAMAMFWYGWRWSLRQATSNLGVIAYEVGTARSDLFRENRQKRDTVSALYELRFEELSLKVMGACLRALDLFTPTWSGHACIHDCMKHVKSRRVFVTTQVVFCDFQQDFALPHLRAP